MMDSKRCLCDLINITQIDTTKMSLVRDTSILKDPSDPIIASETPGAPEPKVSVCNILNDLKFDGIANPHILNNDVGVKPQNTDGSKERDKKENKLPKLTINFQNIEQSQLVNDLSKVRSPMDDKNSSNLVITRRKEHNRDSFPIPNKQKQPVMGRTALLKKANIDPDSLIIQSLILSKYDNVLSHYVGRMYKRRASRHGSSDFSDDDYNESPSPLNIGSPYPVSTASAACGSSTCRSVGSERSRFEFPAVGDYKYPFYAASYYVPRKSLEFLKSTDDFNVESTSEEFDDSVVTSDTGQADVSDYDPKTFLENALGDLKSVSQLDVYDTNLVNMDKRPSDQIAAASNVSALLSKAGSMYSSLKKNIKRRRHSLKAACLEEHQIHQHSPATNRLLENLKKDLSIQNSIMFQISKALNYCRASKEFVSGKEHIEAEKILLVATITKEALISEINSIEFNTYENKFDPRCSGAIRICAVALNLKKKTSPLLRATESKEYFLAVAACGRKIIASEVLEATDDAVLFGKCFQFNDLLADFEISLSIYSMNVRNRGHVLQENMRCPSPKSILGCTRDTRRTRDTNTTVYIEPLAFNLLGKCFMRNQELSKAKATGSVSLKLRNVPSHSSIDERVEVKIDQAHTLTNKISGFLTIGIENEHGVTTWNRRWSLLEGSIFRFWNYPSEEEEAEPLGSFDLCYSTAQKIVPADRKICARPRTLMIPIRSGNVDKKYFLSGDTAADVGVWETELNFVLRSLMIWNGLECPL